MSQRILSMVRILIFVNHDITEAITVFLKNIFTALQEFNRYHQQIIEVERIILAEFFLIIFVYVSHFLTVKSRASMRNSWAIKSRFLHRK